MTVSRRPSAQQVASRNRNWRIFKLRGLQTQMLLLTGPRRVLAQQLVDRELALIGAKPKAEHEAAQREAFDAEWQAKRAQDDITETDIPF